MPLNKNKQNFKSQKQTSITQRRELLYKSQNSKKLEGLIETIKSTEAANIRQIRKHFIETKRRCKLEAIRKNYKPLQQKALIPANDPPKIFHEEKPLNTGDPFLDLKQKQAVIMSDRAFTKMPNIVSGQSKRKQIQSSPEQKKINMSRRFQEYDELLSEQNGPIRILLRKKKLIEQNIQEKPSICIKSTNSLFSLYDYSRNQFYKQAENPEKTNKIEKLMENSKKHINNKRFSLRMSTQGSINTLKIKMRQDSRFPALNKSGLVKNTSMVSVNQSQLSPKNVLKTSMY